MKKLLLYTSVFLLFTFFTQAQSVNNEKDTSCIHGQGYWKNHSDCKTNGNGNSRDDTWDLIEGYDINENPSVGEQTIFFKSNQDYCEVFDTNPGKGGKYYILAHKYITTQLNILGTPNSLDPNNIFDESAIFLSRYTPKEVDDSKDLQAESVRLSSELAGFSSTLYCNDIEPPIIGVLLEPVNIEQNSMTLNWTAASDNVGVTNYKIFQDNTLIATVGNVLTYDVTGLNPVTLYSFHITALDAEGNESANSNTVQGLTIDIDPPVIGVLSTPVNIEQTSMTLNWTAAIDNVGVTNYNIFQDNTLIATVGNVLTYDVTGLNPVTLYSFYITALDAVGNESADSNTVQGLTIDTDPPVIGVLSTPVNIEQTSLTLNWTAATDNVGVTNYNIFQDNSLIATVGNVLTYDVTGLSQDTNYDFYITALDNEGNESSNSNVQSIGTLATSSSIVITTTSTNPAWTPNVITNSGLTLKWTVTGGVNIPEEETDKPTFNLNGNKGIATITVVSDDNFLGLTNFQIRNDDIVTIDNLTSATQLTQLRLDRNQISTIDLSGQSQAATIYVYDNNLTSLDVSNNSSVTALRLQNNGISALDISNNPLITNLYADNNNLPSSELDAIVNQLDVFDLSNGTLQIANNTGVLTSASALAYDNLVNVKGWSIDVSAPGPDDTEPPVIGTLNVPTNITQTSLSLDWTAATDNVGVTGYKVFQDNNLVATLGNVLTYDVSGLSAGTSYDFYITAFDGSGNESSNSNVQTVGTLATSSSIVITTTSTNPAWTPNVITNSGLTLKWTVTGGVNIPEEEIDKPTFNLSGNTGIATITVVSDDNFLGLTNFQIRNNGISTIDDLTSATQLTQLRLDRNQISTIDISGQSQAATIYVYDNNLTSLDVSNNSSVTALRLQNNGISALDISNNPLITNLYADNNNLPSSELDAIVNQLDVFDLYNGNLRISGNAGNLTANVSVAYASLIGKGWTIDVPAPASNKNVASKVSIYPNPISSEGEVSFKATSSGGAEVKLYGSTGQFIGTLFNGETTKEKDYILNYDLNKLEQGMYFAVFKIGNETIRKKILITK